MTTRSVAVGSRAAVVNYVAGARVSTASGAPSTGPVRRNHTGQRGVVSQAFRDLLADADRVWNGALGTADPAQRYAAAYLAALRAAAAVLAARATPAGGRRSSAWELLAKVAPEFGEWAAFFAAGSAKRQAIEAGLPRLVSTREADDMVRQSGDFLELVSAAA